MTNLLCGKSLDQIAIERLKAFEDAALAKSPDGYWLAYSGGKDSDVILDLAKRAGVRFTAHYRVTTCDPPEVIRHIRTHPEVIFEKPALTMWQLIRKKGMPPRRNCRFCCAILKETGGTGRLIITGVRWQESAKRAKRRIVETCFRGMDRTFLHPIIDWHTSDIWHYLQERHIETCSLYAEGFKRIGCVLCPMRRDVDRQIARWPGIAALWEKAVKATWKKGVSSFDSPENLWRWWLDRDSHKTREDGQLMFLSN